MIVLITILKKYCYWSTYTKVKLKKMSLQDKWIKCHRATLILWPWVLILLRRSCPAVPPLCAATVFMPLCLSLLDFCLSKPDICISTIVTPHLLLHPLMCCSPFAWQKVTWWVCKTLDSAEWLCFRMFYVSIYWALIVIAACGVMTQVLLVKWFVLWYWG